jgi:succinoglycan biosynthesis transport protein ExoP
MENIKPLDDLREGMPELKAGGITPVPVSGGPLEYAASGPASHLPPALTASPDVMSLLLALRRRWLAATGLGLLFGAIVAVAAWYLVPKPRYKATTLLQVRSFVPSIIFQTSENRSDYLTYQRTQLAWIKSRLVLNGALRQPGIADLPSVRAQTDPVEWLEREIQVDLPWGSEILRISLESDKSQDLAQLVNAVAQSYLEEVIDNEQTDRRIRYEKLKEIYNTYQEKLQKNRGTIRKLAESVGSNDKQTMALRQQMAMEELAIGKSELLQVRADLQRIAAELEVLQAAERNPGNVAVPDTLVDAQLERERVIEQYRNREAELIERFHRVRKGVRNENDPALQSLRSSLTTVQTNLAKYRAELRPRIAQQLRDLQQSKQPTKSSDLLLRKDVLANYEKVLQKEVERLDKETHALNRDSLDLQSMQDEIANADAAARKIGAEVETLTVELEAPPRVRSIEKAEIPRLESPTKRYKMVAGLALGAMAMVVSWISYWEYRARRINSMDEVAQGLGIRIVGVIPAMPQRLRQLGTALPDQPSGTYWMDLLTESIDATRTMLLHDLQRQAIKVLMITSASKGEGKSSLSSHLAISLARIGSRTLLIDFDMRSPSLHRLFDCPLEPGVSEVLRGEAGFEDVIAPVLSGLDLIRAGRSDQKTLQALAQGHLVAFFDSLRPRYDFIIVDTAPVLAVADTLLISQYVDAAIFSVFCEVSRIPLVYAGYERLAKLGVRLLGVVTTGVPVTSYGYGYGYGYGHSYGSAKNGSARD